jgi:hypothetical protein
MTNTMDIPSLIAVVQKSLSKIFGSSATVELILGGYIKVTIPSEGAEVILAIRNHTSTSRDISGEMRLQISVSDSIAPILSAALKAGTPILVVGVSSHSTVMTAEDPIKFAAQLADQIGSGSNKSKAYSNESVIEEADSTGVAVHRYANDPPQISVSFRPEYLGWYISNFASIHEIGEIGEVNWSGQLREWAIAWTPSTSHDTSKDEGDAPKPSMRTGKYGGGGESQQHKDLKMYVAKHPELVGLTDLAIPYVETGFASFRTGDHCDVVFRGGGAPAKVVEVELAGAANLVTGIHQAVKYRSLAAARMGLELLGTESPVEAAVVAYEANYDIALEAGELFNVEIYQGEPGNSKLDRLV